MNDGFDDKQFEEDIKLDGIFMPHYRQHRDSLYRFEGKLRNEVPFVHYSSAEAALNIIKHKRLWMRNTRCMADFLEVQHGFDILRRFFSDEKKKTAFQAIDRCVSGSASDAVKLFDQWYSAIRFDSYISCISEHQVKEDVHGRLSMWRAFGGSAARVAIVMRIPWKSPAGRALGILFGPVAYLSEDEVHNRLLEVVDNVAREATFLQSLERQRVVGFLFNMLLANVACSKHEGFREEREWRAIFCPQIHTGARFIDSSVETVNGIPQIIYKIPLDKAVDEVLSDLDFAKIFDRLIIGPSQYSSVMVNAFIKELVKAGVPDPERRVVASNIPIRSQ